MFGHRKEDLENSRRQKREAIANLRQGEKAAGASTGNLDFTMDRLAKSTTHAMIETIEFMRGKRDY